jgi:hypothetical protein
VFEQYNSLPVFTQVIEDLKIKILIDAFYKESYPVSGFWVIVLLYA